MHDGHPQRQIRRSQLAETWRSTRLEVNVRRMSRVSRHIFIEYSMVMVKCSFYLIWETSGGQMNELINSSQTNLESLEPISFKKVSQCPPSRAGDAHSLLH